MVNAVRNWKFELNGTVLYQDLVDSNRVHYGPSLTWGNLLVKPLGDRATIVQGEIDLGYSASQLSDLAACLKGKFLAPLIATKMTNTIKLRESSPPGHVINLTVLSSLPFPKIQLNASIAHSVADYSKFLEELRQSWANKSLLAGELILEYEMIDVDIAYSLSLKYQESASALRDEVGPGLVSRSKIYKAIMTYVENNISSIAVTLFPDRSRPFEAEVKSYVFDTLTADLLTPPESIILFDSGEKTVGQGVREPGTLNNQKKFPLIRSNETTESIHVF